MMKGFGPVIFSIDIETRGQGPISHGIMSIGVCIGSALADSVISKHRFDLLPLKGQSMEPRCYKEFWSKHQNHFKTLTQNATDAQIAMEDFRLLLDKTDDMNDEVYIVCDNPGFDVGFINYYLDYFKLPTLFYKHTNDPKRPLEYRNVHDADSYGRGHMGHSFNQQWLSNEKLLQHIDVSCVDPSQHNHLPENDAEVIYRIHLYTVVSAEKKKKESKSGISANQQVLSQ